MGQTRYLLVHAAGFRLLVDAALVQVAGSEPMPGLVDLSRALAGGAAGAFVRLSGTARACCLGVDAVGRLLLLDEADLARLPRLTAAAAGLDIDAVTCAPYEGGHAFRLRMHRSSPVAHPAASAA